MPEELVIEPRALKGMMDSKQTHFLLDCREPHEYQAARIDGATLIPMRQVAQNLEQIPKDRPVIVYCHHGMRSLDVTFFLRSKGVAAKSLAGGIDRWSMEIDSSVPRY
jgi:rhodanese-related sulfurtransferase